MHHWEKIFLILIKKLTSQLNQIKSMENIHLIENFHLNYCNQSCDYHIGTGLQS